MAERESRPYEERPNAQRQNMYGGTFGNPIIKNKLFNFFSIEDWKINSPYSYSENGADRA